MSQMRVNKLTPEDRKVTTLCMRVEECGLIPGRAGNQMVQTRVKKSGLTPGKGR